MATSRAKSGCNDGPPNAQGEKSIKNDRSVRVLFKALIACFTFWTGLTQSQEPSARKPIDPASHPLGKVIVQIGQVGAHPLLVGNGFVAGKNGCHVVTNFHIAFGKGKDASGQVSMVDKIDVGHVVEVFADLDPRTGQMARKIRARVVDFGNYKANDTRGMRNDLAMLKLDECLGKAYGIARFETPKEGEKVPNTAFSTLSLSASEDGN